jgi:hypothetical protein
MTTPLQQLRWLSPAALALGITLALASGWFDQEAVASTSEALAHSANAVSGRLFAAAAVFILIAILERQHARTLSRLKRLEQELAALKSAV